jgi:hypothetical protein
MYINITDSSSSDNKGSSSGLVNYLEKENQQQSSQDIEYWFNDTNGSLEPFEVRSAIDHNVAKLGKKDSKFFLVNISPSQKEITFLKTRFGQHELKINLKKYAQKVMDEYALNFKRHGVESSSDLVWFGKLEQFRYYRFTDTEVVDGERKRGEKKDGEQMHVQIIVSRKDKTNKIKLSPMNKSKGRNELHSKKMGEFDRLAFKQTGEKLFDDFFQFNRDLKDTIAYANILKNGDLEQRTQLGILKEGENLNSHSKQNSKEIANEITSGIFKATTRIVDQSTGTATALLERLLQPIFPEHNDAISNQQSFRGKKKKSRHPDNGLGR